MAGDALGQPSQTAPVRDPSRTQLDHAWVHSSVRYSKRSDLVDFDNASARSAVLVDQRGEAAKCRTNDRICSHETGGDRGLGQQRRRRGARDAALDAGWRRLEATFGDPRPIQRDGSVGTRDRDEA